MRHCQVQGGGRRWWDKRRRWRRLFTGKREVEKDVKHKHKETHGVPREKDQRLQKWNLKVTGLYDAKREATVRKIILWFHDTIAYHNIILVSSGSLPGCHICSWQLTSCEVWLVNIRALICSDTADWSLLHSFYWYCVNRNESDSLWCLPYCISCNLWFKLNNLVWTHYSTPSNQEITMSNQWRLRQECH